MKRLFWNFTTDKFDERFPDKAWIAREYVPQTDAALALFDGYIADGVRPFDAMVDVNNIAGHLKLSSSSEAES